jgi:predicted nucleic acid-binding protein
MGGRTMNKYVIDTQALVKFLNGKKVMNDTIDLILKQADAGEHIIIIPAVVIFEIGYLYETNRIPISIEDIKTILKNSMNYVEEKLSIEIIESAFGIKDIPELHDRLIAGTAYYPKILRSCGAG